MGCPSNGHLKSLDTVQAKQVKQFMGLGSRTHHSHLLSALGIRKMNDIITQGIRSLFYRVLLTDTPYRNLVIYQMSMYISNNSTVKGTLLHKMLECNINPFGAMLTKRCATAKQCNGIVDTLKNLVSSRNYNHKDSFEYNFTKLLVKSFLIRFYLYCF
jgi:uncharacterized protein YjgD (DUF1641 family)